MAEETAPPISSFFDEYRCDSEWQRYKVFVYSPIGIILCILRIFIALHVYVVACILPKMTAARNFVLEMMFLVLGIQIKRDTSRSAQSTEAKVFISNHISRFDFIIYNLIYNANTPNMSSFGWPSYSCETFGLVNLGRNTRSSRSTFLSRLKSFLSKTDTPIVLFPEEGTTNGKKGLLKFTSWPVSACNCVQPVVLSANRPFTNASLSPSLSNWYSDVLWFFFTPLTIFTIKYLPVIKRTENESDDDLTLRIENSISVELQIIKSNYTANDKLEYERRLKRERTISTQSQPRQYSSRIYAEANRIKEILPHIPLNVILRELSRSHGNSEMTIARLIDTYQAPSPNTSSSSAFNQSTSFSSTSSSPTPVPAQFNSSPHYRMSAFAERKIKFIEEARKRYIEKHGLTVK